MDLQLVLELEAKLSTRAHASALMQATEAWLEARQFLPRGLPPLLRREHERQTRAARARNAFLISIFGACVALLFTPTLLLAVPDMRVWVIRLYLCGAIPFSAIVSLLVLANPPPAWRDGLLALNSLVNGAVLTWLFTHTGADATELYVAGMILLMLFATITVQLPFTLAAVVMVLQVLLFAIGAQSAPGETPYFHENLALIDFACGCYMLVANGQLQTTQQRGFVLALRERLRRQELFQRNLELDDLARRDALTGLANRRAFDAWLLNCWRQAREAGVPLGLIVVDVDWFKAYNDVYGHPAGDVCLQTIARCLREQLRGTTDHVARLGGEEFAVLLEGLNADLCGDVAERLRAGVAAMELPHIGAARPGGGGATVTISCGVASLPAHLGTSARDLMAAADAALYRAKQNGRNLVCLADTPNRGGGGPHAHNAARPAGGATALQG